MIYYIFSIAMFGAITFTVLGCALYLVRRIILKKAKQDDDFICACLFVIAALTFIMLITYCLDIPSVLNGGEVVYTNEMPEIIHLKGTSYVYSDNPELSGLKGFNPDEYEKYGNYRIRYTKINKFVLEVERLD